jgi:hypothetical protein
MARNSIPFDVANVNVVGSLTHYAKGIKVPLTVGSDTYNSFEELLNAIVEQSLDAFCQKYVGKLHFTVVSPSGLVPPVVQLWEVKSAIAPAEEGVTATFHSVASLMISSEKNGIRYLGAAKLVASYVNTNYFHVYEMDVTVKGDRNNPHFYWSDEHMEEPNNRSHLYATAISHSAMSTFGVVGSGTLFAETSQLDEVLE